MTMNTRFLLALLIGVIVGFGLSQGPAVLAQKSEDQQSIPLEELRTFTEIFAKIKSDYVEPVSDKKLLDDAIKGMVAGLDPHSAYLDNEAYGELRIGTTGEFGGLGIEVGMEDGFVKVISPIDDTPAARAGVQAGDLIIRLDDKPVKGMTLRDAVNVMRGKPGSDITLTVVREGEEKPLKIVITRDIIKVRSVKQRTLEPGYGYVRISQFQSTTARFLDEAVDKLKKENDGKLKGLVLDLRNNPGGVLNGAVDVSDAFLESGLIVYTEGRLADSKIRFQAKPEDILKGAPLVVLVNGGSASASEIVAGALQDHKRAVIMGDKTFGKGSVQTIVPMQNNTAVKLTTARYFTPSGRSIQAEGIEPDIKLRNIKLTEEDTPAIESLKERDLSGHLENPVNGEGDKPKTNTGAKKADEITDYYLHEALNLLKGMNIVRTSRL